MKYNNMEQFTPETIVELYKKESRLWILRMA